MKISIFGLGYVGVVSASCLASRGYNVIGVDIIKEKVDRLNAGKALIIEPNLTEMTAAVVANGKLKATVDTITAINETDVSFVCVGTPSLANGSPDYSYIESVSHKIALAIKKKQQAHIIIFRSTLLPGTIENLIIPLLEKNSSKKSGIDFFIGFNPEFMKEGSAINDYFNPPKNVLGCIHKKVFSVISEINHKMTGMKTILLDIKSAEMIKFCDNAWHALKVGFANEVGNLCKSIGIDSHEVMNVFCKDTLLNISPYYLKPGFAFGGSCLPKDLRALLREGQRRDVVTPILNSVLPSNQLQIEKAVKMIIACGHKNVGILGFSFKNNTDDLRESPVVELIERLTGKGFKLTVYDKNVNASLLHGSNKSYVMQHVPHLFAMMVDSIDIVLKKSTTIVIGNAADDFKVLPDKISNHHVVIDLVRAIEKPTNNKSYHGICW